jgi:hypothetical protein
VLIPALRCRYDEFALFAAGDLVLDEQGQEIHVGEFLLHGLSVATYSESRMPERRSRFEQN